MTAKSTSQIPRTGTISELTQQILNLQQGDHLCLFYEKDPAEQMPALIPFIQEGLARDEQFIYVADDQTVDELTERLEKSGVNVRKEVRGGRLKLWTRKEWRQSGALNSKKKLRQVKGFIDDALAAGFKGIRFAVEMTWTLGPDIPATQLEHWKATMNTIFVPGSPGRIICQYNRSRLSPDVLLVALHTHPLVISGDHVYPNCFYQAPLILAGNKIENSNGKSSIDKFDWMISQLERTRVRWREEASKELAARKRAEKELLEAKERLANSNEELERRVQERTASLREAVQQMEEFSYTVSHDLRAPLRTMQGFSQIVIEDFGHKLGPEANEYMARISTASARLDQMIQDVLAYSRLARSQINSEAIDLKEVIESVIDEHSELHSPRAEIEIAGEIPNVVAQQSALTQCVANLLGNAVKFISPGTKAKVRIHMELVNNDARIYFADNGIGIDPKDHRRIWNMFERVYPNKNYEGTGVGLAIVRKAVEKMGGQAGVESDLGKGSKFWIQLPRA